MQKTLTSAVTILAASMIFLGNAIAQQAPATNTPPAPAAPPQKAPAAAPAGKAGQAPAAQPHQAPAAKSTAPFTLKTQKDKVSYAIGLNIGKSLHKDSLDIDTSILLRGLKDALAGGKTLLTDEEAKATMVALQNGLRKKQEEKMLQVGDLNKKEGQAFLDANKAKDGVVTLPSGLQYKILKAGTGQKPSATDTVVVNYKGTLIDNTEFDSSYKRGQPATFQVGKVIAGWTEALQLMPVGSKWELFVSSELAYGQHGAGGNIGPNATLIFEVELLSIQGKDKPE